VKTDYFRINDFTKQFSQCKLKIRSGGTLNLRKAKVPYLHILFTVIILTILILIIPFTGQREAPDEFTTDVEDTLSEKSEPTASDILTKVLQAHGGIEKISSIRSIKMTTTSLLGPEKNEYADEAAYYNFPDQMRSEAKIGTDTFIQTYSHGSAWLSENDIVGEADLRTLEILRRSLKHFPNFILQASDSVAIVMIKSKSFIEGKPHYTVFVIDKDSDETTLWIAFDDFLVKRMDYPVFAAETEEHMRLDFSDYRETGGIQFPHSVDIHMNGVLVQQTTVLSYDVNPPVPDSSYFVPQPIKQD
jgi:hypothetical protein